MHEFWSENVEEFKQLLRISPYLLNELLEMICMDVQKESILLREPIPAKLEVAAILTPAKESEKPQSELKVYPSSKRNLTINNDESYFSYFNYHLEW